VRKDTGPAHAKPKVNSSAYPEKPTTTQAGQDTVPPSQENARSSTKNIQRIACLSIHLKNLGHGPRIYRNPNNGYHGSRPYKYRFSKEQVPNDSASNRSGSQRPPPKVTDLTAPEKIERWAGRQRTALVTYSHTHILKSTMQSSMEHRIHTGQQTTPSLPHSNDYGT